MKLRHLGIIMDGNGRWAEARGLERFEGHKEGFNALLRLIDRAIEREIECLSVFAYSIENWKRPEDERRKLFSLFESAIEKERTNLKDKGIRVVFSGSRENLEKSLVAKMSSLESYTASGKNLTIQVLFNYSGSDEITRLIRRAVGKGIKSPTFDDLLANRDNPELPMPDMIVRSAGEKRLSGFLLLQSGYTELAFYDRLFPDWNAEMIDNIIIEYSKRKRKFGGLI